MLNLGFFLMGVQQSIVRDLAENLNLVLLMMTWNHCGRYLVMCAFLFCFIIYGM